MSKDEIRDDAILDSDDDADDTRQPSTYEKIMVAAREAKRLNAAVQDGAPQIRKPTTLAMKRVSEDGVPYRFRDADEVKAPIEGNEFEDGGDD